MDNCNFFNGGSLEIALTGPLKGVFAKKFKGEQANGENKRF